jgi:hypothetical protein
VTIWDEVLPLLPDELRRDNLERVAEALSAS